MALVVTSVNLEKGKNGMPESSGSQKKMPVDVKPTQTNAFLLHSNDAHQVVKTDLNQIKYHKEQLERLRKNLQELEDVFIQHSSLFSKAAAFWGELPWWPKGVG